MTNWFQDALDTLRKLADLKENWGVEGELPITGIAISNAMRLAYQLDKQQMPQPTIVPGRDGEVQMEWHIGGNYLEIVCFTDYAYFCQIGEVETHGLTLEPLALVTNCLEKMQ